MPTTSIVITNNLARAVGTIARRHPEAAVQIEWREGAPEYMWLVTTTDGVTDTAYLVDDESGTHMPATAAELVDNGYDR